MNNWDQFFMKTKLVVIVAPLLLIASMGMIAWLWFSDRRATVASLTNSQIGDVRVVGKSDDRFEEWAFWLCWRKGNGPWMEYLLDRQVPLWSNVELIPLSNSLVVTRGGEIFGTLSMVDGSFSNQFHARVESRPQVIVTSEDPLDGNRTNRIEQANPAWESAWSIAVQSK